MPTSYADWGVSQVYRYTDQWTGTQGRGSDWQEGRRTSIFQEKGVIREERFPHTGTEDSVLKALGRQIWYLRLLWQLRLWDAEPDSSSSSS